MTQTRGRSELRATELRSLGECDGFTASCVPLASFTGSLASGRGRSLQGLLHEQMVLFMPF